MEGTGAPTRSGVRALVSCEDCGSRWHGPISAHGLRVIGHCPRCLGPLSFRDDRASIARLEETAVAAVQPWQVLGTPSSWAR